MDEAYHLSEWEERITGPYVPALLEPLGIKEGTVFLDLGCGSGYVNAYLAARGQLGRNLGLELAQDTIRLAQKLTHRNPAIGWVCASAEAIPLPDAAVDHVVCRGVVPLARAQRVVAETSRVLRPGGTAVFLLHRWNFYLPWLSLHPRHWKKSAAGLLHTILGCWFNLTGQQVQIRIGSHLFGQTFQTDFRMRRLSEEHGLRLYKVVHKPEYLVYVSRFDGEKNR